MRMRLDNMYLINMLFVFCFMQTDGEQIADLNKLLGDVFSSTVYNKQIRGQNDLTQTTNVTVTFSLHKILKFDELLESIQFHGKLLTEWVDERLVWSLRKYNGLKTVYVPANTVWTPEFGIANPSRSFRQLGGDPSRLLTRHDNQGKVLWDIGDTFECSCLVDLTLFPWDSQKCSLQIAVWGYDGNEIQLIPNQTTVGLDAYKTNGEWILEKTNVIRRVTPSKSVLVYQHTLRRRPVFFCVNVMLPIVTISVLTLFVFYIPIDSGERISFSLTLLLSTVIFMTLMSTSLPPNAETMPTACYFLLYILMHSTITFLLSILSMHIYFKSNGDEQPGQIWKSLYNNVYKIKPRCRKVKVSSVRSLRTSDDKEEDMYTQEQDLGETVSTTTTTTSVSWKNISEMTDCIFFYIMTLLLLSSYAMFAVFIVQII